MLFAISGSQGTGKTTLLNALGYPCVDRKTSRSILADWGVTLSQVNNDRALTVRFQEEILARKLSDEIALTDVDEVHFTERTYADLFAYALVAIGKDNEYSNWLDDYYQQCMQAQRNAYAFTFYLKGGHFAPVDDGVRAVNQHYSWMVDVTIQEYTSRMSGTNILLIDTPSIDERVDIVTSVVDTYSQHLHWDRRMQQAIAALNDTDVSDMDPELHAAASAAIARINKDNTGAQ